MVRKKKQFTSNKRLEEIRNSSENTDLEKELAFQLMEARERANQQRKKEI